MSDKVLVDTSSWIDYFTVAQSPVRDTVSRLLRERLVVYTGIIALELIRGAKTSKEQATLDALFDSIERVDEQPTTHLKAGRMGARLARQGVTIGTVDLLIAQLAIENMVRLHTQDRHFRMIAEHVPLRLYENAPRRQSS